MSIRITMTIEHSASRQVPNPEYQIPPCQLLLWHESSLPASQMRKLGQREEGAAQGHKAERQGVRDPNPLTSWPPTSESPLLTQLVKGDPETSFWYHKGGAETASLPFDYTTLDEKLKCFQTSFCSSSKGDENIHQGGQKVQNKKALWNARSAMNVCYCVDMQQVLSKSWMHTEKAALLLKAQSWTGGCGSAPDFVSQTGLIRELRFTECLQQSAGIKSMSLLQGPNSGFTS